jgi:hypothetical protein
MQVIEKHNPARAEWIRNYFKGDDVFIVGGGPSLFGFDFSRLDGRRVIAINHSYRYCKPEILVFLDGKFKREAAEMGHDLYEMPFKIVAGPSSGMKNQGNCTVVQIAQKPSMNPGVMYGRAQSGLIAINVAIIGGARNIYLLGFDAKFNNGIGHFYSKDWKHTMDDREHQYAKMAHCYNNYKEYQNIFNCNPDSGIIAFKKITIGQALGGKS